MSTLSKKKNDISFIDPVTMEVVCTFNQCVKKFTKEGTDVIITDKGKEFISCYHQCEECGRKVIGKGDKTKGWMKKLDRVIT